ncbi:hypothetical protein [Cellulomonas alba]|uniref:Uncharacterized protein n=1 Tax=Cellulomonas alba TaxID=3053467 RepID=A0ABT7SBA2_9CELL|nr:hypothetical protein [Cellulomonas alba]MDM7853465.1 hypothetical protein [Cellulomonas alba]
MITTDNPLQVAGTVLFRDGSDPDLFWVLPRTPHVAARADGTSSFSLLEYRTADGSGGGFAELELELEVPGGAALAAQTGRENARVEPLAFRSGTVSLLSVSGPSDALVQAVLGASSAPLTAPFHTVFALDVTPQGAALLAQSATAPTLPVGVVYELTFLAQTPAVHAHVTMDYQRMYDHFSTSLGFTYYVNARIDADLQWLVEHDVVKIEITELTDDADAQRQRDWVMDLVSARVQADFFRSALPTATDDTAFAGALGQLVSRGLGTTISSASALFTLKARLDVERELKTFELFYDGRGVQELTHVVSGFVGAMLAGSDAPPDIRQITAEDPFFATLDVAVVVGIDFDDVPDLREAAVTLTYGTHVETFVATPDTPGPFRFTCPFDAASPAYTTHVEFHFDPASTAGPATIAAPDTSRRDRAFVVSTADAFQVCRVHVSGIGAGDGVVEQLPVTMTVLDADGTVLSRDALALDAEHTELDWYRRVPGTVTPRVRAEAGWVDAGGATHAGDEVDVVGTSFVARGPFVAAAAVLVQPAVDWTAVTQLAVELRRTVLGTVQDTSLLFSAAAGTEPKQLTLPLTDATERGYEWQATILRADGTTGVTPWRTSDAALLLVADDVAGRASVRLVWLGDPGAALAMRVDFWTAAPAGGEQQVASALLQPTATDVTVTWSSPGLAPGAVPPYRYEVHRLDAAGDSVVSRGSDAGSLVVVRTNG